MPNTFDNYDDIIDSRDVIERINDLQCLADDGEATEDEINDLAILRKLEDQGSQSPDWEYGEGLIRRSYFVEYAEQLAYDIGAANEDATWPNCHIDWEAAARSLEMDYFAVDFDGVEYLIRA